jgi:hypothetical protein
VKYRKNGTLLYQSLVAPTYPLLVDTSLRDPGAVSHGSRDRGHVARRPVSLARRSAFALAGDYASAQNVTVQCLTSGAVIHYTTNGIDPTEADPVVASGNSVVVNQSLTLKARAFATNLFPSVVKSARYTIGLTSTAESVSWTNVVKRDRLYGSDPARPVARTAFGTQEGCQPRASCPWMDTWSSELGPAACSVARGLATVTATRAKPTSTTRCTWTIGAAYPCTSSGSTVARSARTSRRTSCA